MADDNQPVGGTLIIASLLILAIGFAGYWIVEYASTGGPPWGLARNFGIAAVVIVIVGLALYWRRRGV